MKIEQENLIIISPFEYIPFQISGDILSRRIRERPDQAVRIIIYNAAGSRVDHESEAARRYVKALLICAFRHDKASFEAVRLVTDSFRLCAICIGRGRVEAGIYHHHPPSTLHWPRAEQEVPDPEPTFHIDEDVFTELSRTDRS